MQDKSLFIQQINLCLNKLQCLQQSVSKQQWDRVLPNVSDYENEVYDLKKYTAPSDDLPEGFQQQLQNLYSQQNRVMRMIHEAQGRNIESTRTAENGIRKINRLAEFVS
ncbi:MAG: hypothetical protein R8M14_05500 [Ghiorsea sp.]